MAVPGLDDRQEVAPVAERANRVELHGARALLELYPLR
jgi:hypothetical protein